MVWLLAYPAEAKAVETFGPGDNLLRFFANYYAAISLMTFVLQTLSSRFVLERFGLALTTSTPSIALLAGGLGSIVAPGLGGLLVARGGESIFRGSWFRAGSELLYTPLPPAEKRAAKSLIDVAFDRLGDAIGGGFVRLSLFAPLGAILRRSRSGHGDCRGRVFRGQSSEPLVRPYARSEPSQTRRKRRILRHGTLWERQRVTEFGSV
jgi:hypothetical protein